MIDINVKVLSMTSPLITLGTDYVGFGEDVLDLLFLPLLVLLSLSLSLSLFLSLSTSLVLL